MKIFSLPKLYFVLLLRKSFRIENALLCLSLNLPVCIFRNAIFISVPSKPKFFHACEVNNKTEEICISWLKPEGGNEIDNYIINWIVEDNLNYSHSIAYYGMESNSYAIKHLQPAQEVNVSIRANNSAGESEASWKPFATGRTFITIPNTLLLSSFTIG